MDPAASLTPDLIPIHLGPFTVSATVFFTWLIMLWLVLGAWWITRKLSAATHLRRGQNLLEVLVLGICHQIEEISEQPAEPFLPFIGTLFIFIAVSNVLAILPGYHPPTGSLSTTAALAICVFFAVPIFGIKRQGLKGYLSSYVQPNPIMLPFNIIGELSRTISLSVRLFGNVMSGTMIVGILLSVAPLFAPVVMRAFGLLTGLIQAYIFAILAMVAIAAATEAQNRQAPATLATNHSDSNSSNSSY
ncbi:ATP synthase F0, A subunit [Synechococcus sp. PCC 7335]|uniref:F0F1 ATP synthase subunit A n=1 Tax=Synechococcus sp. (strain ATCC 29403 / PCC 7335) TaxID=91464 RepID=UPI00017ED9D6|nr:F0F1 ATP synthase subunit A [Synechococcus sp. PCC 7335]EDX83398.1 ATP synthase F0, A subunit [Synechococcus sp. PCC 7335]